MASGDDSTTKTQGEAAYKAVRKHFLSLAKVVATGDIVERLYEEEIVDDSTLEIVTATNTTLTNKQKGSKILQDVQISVESKPSTFDTFCRILKSEGREELSHQLRGIVTL